MDNEIGDLEAIAVGKTYVEGGREHVVLDSVDARFCAGESVALLGRSGSGKSTLLNLLSGIDSPTRGTVLVSGKNLTAASDEARTLIRRRQMGFVFQFFNLLPALSVVENIMLPRTLIGDSRSAARVHARSLLKAVGLKGREDSYADRLSGGEQQRVALARAIAHEPEIVFADEPTGNLDATTSSDVLALLEELVKKRGVTLVMATHSEEAAGICSRRVRVENGALVETPSNALRTESA